MKQLATLTILALLILSACVVHPVQTQEAFNAMQTATAAVPPLPSFTPAIVPPTATEALVPTPTNTPTCTILGNINAQGVKTAFKPGDAPYSQVKLDKPGERCFATMDDAVAAGFAPYRGN